ncbi:MAG: hypothetical protein GY822_06705 [Deltaproteobacteria bacterium]|nr:hypothetical protein [Deltaproteobacteria bacterium]
MSRPPQHDAAASFFGVSLSTQNERSPRGSHFVKVVATVFGLFVLSAAFASCKRPVVIPEEQVNPQLVVKVATPPQGRKPSEGQNKLLGTGWYANVEVDSLNRIHVAWTDADVGDVLYAVSAPGSNALKTPQVVEHEGAVGSYLKLALAPGDVPILSYYQQDRRVLRLSHRPKDYAALKAAGVLVDENQSQLPTHPLFPGEDPPRPPEAGMGPLWHGEDVAFGEGLGIAGAFVVDKKGYPHLTSYTRGERMRYYVRPNDGPAFGRSVMERFEKIDVDPRASGTYRMVTDLLVQDDGTVVASYCHFNYVDAQLRMAVRKKGEGLFDVVEAEPLLRRVDGWYSQLLPSIDGENVEVYSVTTGNKLLLHSTFNPRQAAPFEKREEIFGRPGAIAVARAKEGTLWILTRGQGFKSLGETPGLWLIELAQGDVGKAKKWVLEEGLVDDPWIDLALRPDGRPVAVWTAKDKMSIQMYAP